MIKNPFRHLVGHKETIKTYELSRLQAKSHRFIKNFINDILAHEKLSALEWGILGLLNENKEGLRYIEIAQHMGVEPPFITELISQLGKLRVIQTKDSEKDKRSKVVTLSDKGKKRVEAIETQLEERFKSRFVDISSTDWQTYKEVMDRIIMATETNKLS